MLVVGLSAGNPNLITLKAVWCQSIKARHLDELETKTTRSEREVLDDQVAKFIYATNSSFRIMEHPEFIQMINRLRLG